MRRFSMFLILAFVLSVTVGWAAEAPKPEAKPKAASKDGSVEKGVANAKVKQLSRQYRDYQQQKAKVLDTIRNIYSANDAQGAAGASIQPEDACLPVVIAKLQVVQMWLARQNDKGYGDLEYWTRTRALMNNQGNMAVSELNAMLLANGAEMNGLLRAALKNIHDNLRTAMAKYDGGYGDLNYWTAACTYSRDAIWAAASNLNELLAAIAVQPHANTPPVIKAKLETISHFLNGQTDKGYGDLEYWTRTYSQLGMQASNGTEALNRLMQESGSTMNGLLQTAIKNVITNLNAAAKKYDGGYGTIDYWITACGFVRDGMHSASKNINEILGSI